MAWTSPKTFVANNVLTAAELNTHLRDNLLETEAAKALNFGGIFVADGPNTILERVGGSDYISKSESTNSTTYTDLATVGPTVTCTTSSRALYFMTCQMAIDTDNFNCQMSIQISGETNVAAIDEASLMLDGVPKDKANVIGVVNFIDDLTPGVNVFTAKYRCSSGNTATFSDRNLTVIPF